MGRGEGAALYIYKRGYTKEGEGERVAYWLKGALCNPPSKLGGKIATEAFATGPRACKAAPEIPGWLEMEMGVQSSQHSIIDSFLWLADMAVNR